MPQLRAPIVGIYFRPPAKAILQCLPGGASLRLEREPDNQWDACAVKVWIRTADIPEAQYETLDALASGFGSSLREVLLQAEHLVGYIDSKKTGNAAIFSAALDAGAEPRAVLAFGLAGEPIAVLG